ncbi:MAG: flagellar biosynthesis anti-sigma factor FlgM [Pseudomonas sp.]
MSQKIDGTLPATSSLRSGSVSGKVSSAGSPVAPASSSDSLSLTGEATNLQALQRNLSQASAIDNSRVQAVRDSLQSGNYKVDADTVANRLLSLDQQLAG